MTVDVQWFGNAGHFICGQWCRFHMTTKVGKYLVSTVGQYWPDRDLRRLLAKRDPEWYKANAALMGDNYDAAHLERFGYGEIGYNRTFETMVFECGAPCSDPECGCGMPSIGSGHGVDFDGYHSAGDATEGHRRMVAKWLAHQEAA